MTAPFTIVTATLSPARATDCWSSWTRLASQPIPVVVVWSSLPGVSTACPSSAFDCFPDLTLVTRDGGGVVPAFGEGVARAAADGASAILCLHSDVLIEEPHWDLHLRTALGRGVRYAGFAGATGLGAPHIYQSRYDPHQLARRDFVSNLREAEQHGRRGTSPERCVVFDELSLFGTTDWFAPAWATMAASGVVHHCYGAFLAILAQKAGAQPGWMLPVRCHHYGGREAVALPAYQDWSRTLHPLGDEQFWIDAHQIVYHEGRGVLPLRTW
jgi:hypothetical protein